MRESPNLNLLRAIAVLAVFISHVLPMSKLAFNLGHAGVLLFFVHTSNVLMLSLERHGDSWWQFMTRRVFRIYPMAVLSVGLYALLRTARTSPETLIANLTLSQNVFGTESVPSVLWSLPYEIQMYLVLPVVFVFARKKRDTFAGWIICAAGTALAVALLPPVIGTIFRFVPCFLAGVLAYARPKTRFLPAAALPLSLATGVLLYCLNPGDFFLSGWLLCLGVGFILPMIRELNNSAISEAVQFIAKYSFGIYLWHMAFIEVAMSRLGPIGILPALTGTFAASYCSFRLLERPLTNFGHRIADQFAGDNRSTPRFAEDDLPTTPQ